MDEELRMAIRILDHVFIPYGGAEMLCRACGYVTWPLKTPRDALEAMKILRGNYFRCGLSHHRFIDLDEQETLDVDNQFPSEEKS